MGRSPSRSRSRSRDRVRDSSSRPPRSRTRSRTRSRSRERDHHTRDRERERDYRDRDRDRERDRDRDSHRSDRYRDGHTRSDGYDRSHQSSRYGQQPTQRFQTHYNGAQQTPYYNNNPYPSAASSSVTSSASSYHPADSSSSSSTSSSAAAAAAKTESFLRFQAALELHNAARNILPPSSSSSSSSTSSSSKSVSGSSTSANGSNHHHTDSSSKQAALVSLGELARKKAETEAATNLAKPVFLSKAERAELALQKLAEKRAAAEAQAAKQQEAMQAFLSSARQAEERQRQDRMAAERKVREERERKREEDKKRTVGAGGANQTALIHANALATSEDLQRARERELQLIRYHYLGQKDPTTKKQPTPAAQKFKFHFDWDAREDTSVDTNVLYKHRHDAAALFGRGFIGGVDRKEQRKKHAFYDELVQYRLEHQPKNSTTTTSMKDEPNGDEEEEEVSRPVDLSLLRDHEKAAAREAREAKRRVEFELKNRHWSKKPLEDMEERDWRIFKEDFSIVTRGSKVPHPLRFWNEANLPPTLMLALEQAGYKDPTPIQRAAIPIGLQFRDVIGLAETGSGKTVAFLVPMLCYIEKQPRITTATSGEGPYAVVMAPTRELAQQISDECNKFSKYMEIRNVCVVGGLSIEEQAFHLREGAEIVIGTPGRLFDLISKRYLTLNVCNYVVLDEADRMIDVGFEAQILQVMDQMPASNMRPENEADEEADRVYRQTVLFSATMPPRVEALAKNYLRNPVHIAVGDREKAAQRIEQRVEWTTSENQKKSRMLEIACNHESAPLIIFSNLKAHIDRICKWLSDIGIGSVALHGGKSQDDRMHALAAFKNGDVPVLVATDVAGRGLDVSGVKHVINFDMPEGADAIEKYKHRIGRTGRAGQTGIATSFIMESDTEIMYDLCNVLKASNQPIPPQLANHESAKFPPGTVREGGPPKPKIQYSSR